jgi:hypothetical protein
MTRRIVPIYFALNHRIAFYRGDGSERCLVCGWRQHPSLYVGQTGMITDEGLPERFPVCSDEHGRMWMEQMFARSFQLSFGDLETDDVPH